MSQKSYSKVSNEDTLRILNVMWYTVAQKTVEKIIEICELDNERADALRIAALRPMDFSVVIDGDSVPIFEYN